MEMLNKTTNEIHWVIVLFSTLSQLWLPEENYFIDSTLLMVPNFPSFQGGISQPFIQTSPFSPCAAFPNGRLSLKALVRKCCGVDREAQSFSLKELKSKYVKHQSAVKTSGWALVQSVFYVAFQYVLPSPLVLEEERSRWDFQCTFLIPLSCKEQNPDHSGKVGHI